MAITRESFDQHCLEEVFNLTQNMLRAAQAGDWKQVADMEMVRCSLLPTHLAFSATNKERVTTILEINSEIIRLANRKLDTIASLWDNALRAKAAQDIDVDHFFLKNTALSS